MSKIMFFTGAGLVLLAIALLIFYMTHPLSYKSLRRNKSKVKENDRKKSRRTVKKEEERVTQLLQETKPLDSDFERQTVLLADYEESDE